VWNAFSWTVVKRTQQLFLSCPVHISFAVLASVGVVMDNGDEIRAPIVVSGAGVFNTYERLLPLEVGLVVGQCFAFAEQTPRWTASLVKCSTRVKKHRTPTLACHYSAM
jgi:hypothetical protein